MMGETIVDERVDGKWGREKGISRQRFQNFCCKGKQRNTVIAEGDVGTREVCISGCISGCFYVAGNERLLPPEREHERTREKKQERVTSR